jgi:hypothetical protein
MIAVIQKMINALVPAFRATPPVIPSMPPLSSNKPIETRMPKVKFNIIN